MTSMQEKFLIIEKNSKIYLVKQVSYDKKRRKYSVSKFSENLIFEISNKDIIFTDITLLDCISLDAKIRYKLKDLWLSLIMDENVINFRVFINRVIDFYNITSLIELDSLILSFNEDFTYFKILDKNKVYLNSESIVTRIELSLSKKQEKKSLYDSFLKDLSLMKACDWSTYDSQIEEIIVYLSGGTKYSRSFLESVKETIGTNKYSEIILHLKSIGLFAENFEPLYSTLKLNSKYSYNKKDIDILASSQENEDQEILDAFTIDDQGSYDFDDAISIKREDGAYLLYIHISNFSSLFSNDSIYIKDAKRIINTIYAPSGNFNLYDRRLVDVMSLKANSIRPVLSIKYKLKDFNIVSCNIEKNFIKVSENFTYEKFESLIESNPDYAFIDKFTENLKIERLKEADFKFFNQEINIKFSKEGMLVINQVEALKSRRIISELMIIANLHCSKYFIANGLTGIFRSQKKSNNLETSIIDENPPFCFHRKVSPLDVSIRPEPHYGLGLKSYMQITSPIRRYFDSINMWQISYFISERRALYDEKEIQTILTTMLPQIATVREKSKKVYKLWILRYLEQIEAKNISGYIYASLKDKYIVFFNELNFFESISKEKCRNLYEKDDFIELSFDFVDIQNLELINLKD